LASFAPCLLITARWFSLLPKSFLVSTSLPFALLLTAVGVPRRFCDLVISRCEVFKVHLAIDCRILAIRNFNAGCMFYYS
ncbi:hypothetical protein, partial [Desulfocucumis palustris]|uniref:hypothetical protein n=1 Tax=Desulfocucumis palustris TaxID=1898651 RepID=UPI001A9A5724